MLLSKLLFTCCCQNYSSCVCKQHLTSQAMCWRELWGTTSQGPGAVPGLEMHLLGLTWAPLLLESPAAKCWAVPEPLGPGVALVHSALDLWVQQIWPWEHQGSWAHSCPGGFVGFREVIPGFEEDECPRDEDKVVQELIVQRGAAAACAPSPAGVSWPRGAETRGDIFSPWQAALPKGAVPQHHLLFQQETGPGSTSWAPGICACLDPGVRAGLQQDAGRENPDPLMLAG